LLVAAIGVQLIGTPRALVGPQLDAGAGSRTATSALPDARGDGTFAAQTQDGSGWIYLASYPTDDQAEERSLGVDRTMTDDPIHAGELDRADGLPLVSRAGPLRPPSGAN
jgi:hypothetical protein